MDCLCKLPSFFNRSTHQYFLCDQQFPFVQFSHSKMTVIYDAENHFDVIFKLQGSVWPKVLPFCLFNVSVTILVYLLLTFADIDLTFNGGLGYTFISTVVSFFVISNLGSTYGRFWEARGHLGTALYESNMLAARAALYTAHDPSDQADIWRSTLKKHLIKLIDSIMYMVQDERASLIFNLMDHEAKTLDFERHGISHSSSLHTMSSVSSMLEEKNVVMDAMRVDATILTADSFVKDGCKNSGELTGRTASIVSAYFNLIKFSTTPRPFVITQMGRTLIFLWIFFLPSAVLNTHQTELYEAMFLVFLVTYGFMGLTLAEIEMHDPLGNDANDLETERYCKLIKCDIEDLLGKNSLSSDGKLLMLPYKVPSRRGTYGTDTSV